MKISVAGRRVELNDALRNYVVSKVEGLERYYDGIISVDVNLNVEKSRQIVDVVAHLVKKKILKVSEESDDMYLSIDQAVNKLKKQLRRHKRRVKERKAKGLDRSTIEAETEAQEKKEIVRTELFLKKPMTAEEAAIQLESFHRDFLIFMDSDRGALSIIHCRKDGNYELIEPKY